MPSFAAQKYSTKFQLTKFGTRFAHFTPKCFPTHTKIELGVRYGIRKVMNQSQELFGTPSEKAASKVRPYMVDWVQSFIKKSPFVVMATSNRNGDCDASPKGGLPGFVKVLSERSLLIPDVAGNRLFQSYENFETNPKVGLIFFIPGIDSSARVNGTIKILRKDDSEFEKVALEVYNADEKAKVLQAILVEVDESYSQCPRALAFSKLWNTENITANMENSPIEKWIAGT